MAKNRLDYTAKLSRHPHNVTAGFTSSLAPAMIVPQYFDILQPNDSIYFRTHMFVRSQDLVTAFLGEVDLHIDYFFVPLQMLYTAFGNVFANTNDVISSFYDISNMVTNAFPVGNMNEFFTEGRYGAWKTLTTNGDYFTDVRLKGAFRLLDALDMNPLVIYRWSSATSQAGLHGYCPNGFYAALLAYNAIYQKRFRNEEIEKFDVGCFNVDDCYMSGQIDANHLDKILKLRFCQRPDDYFTNVRLSPIATSVNSLFNTSNQFNLDGGSSNAFSSIFSRLQDFLQAGSLFVNQYVNGYLGDSADQMVHSGGVTFSSATRENQVNFLNAQNIRSIFALDKYLRVYGRAGKTYDDQILAHFGVKVPHDVKHDITHIKHYHMVLQSDPVLSTADTDNGSLGEVGGNMVGQLDTDEVKFTAPVHGVFMCVAYVVTKPRYYGTCNKLHGIVSPADFPMPEFDKLGAQPLYWYEANSFLHTPTDFPYWQNRFNQWKQKYNRCGFIYAHDYESSLSTNFYSPWVVSRSPYEFGDIRQNSLPFFEVPQALDNVMAVKYNNGWSSEFDTKPHLICQTDPLLTEYCCFAKKVSWMSPTGDPDL